MSCRGSSRGEQKVVVPPKPPSDGFLPDPLEVMQRRIVDAGLPARNCRLMDLGDRSHFGLGDPEYFAADSANRVHKEETIHKWINKSTTESRLGLDRQYPDMYNLAMEISDVIKALLAVREWTQEDLANNLRTRQNNVSRWLDGVDPRGKTRDRILEMARESGVIDDDRAFRATVPIMGYIGAGAEVDPDYEQVPIDGLDQVEVPLLLVDEVIGLQVRGDSMLPKYADGAVIIVYREQTRSTASLVGEEAAVRTYDGRRFLKLLMLGLKPHTYNLESFNARPITEVRIAWASEIVAIIPPRQVRRAARPGTKAGKGAPAPAKREIRR